MDMTYQTENRILTICFYGELDHHAARTAMNSIEKWIEQSLPTKTILNMEGLTFMDSSGIAVVLRAKRRMETMQGGLAVINIPKQAARVLETAGLSRYINLV